MSHVRVLCQGLGLQIKNNVDLSKYFAILTMNVVSVAKIKSIFMDLIAEFPIISIIFSRLILRDNKLVCFRTGLVHVPNF